MKMRRRIAAISLLLLIIGTTWGVKTLSNRAETAEQPAVVIPATIGQQTASASATSLSDTSEIEVITPAPTNTARYELTAEERATIESVITAEAVGEPFAGQIAVAQCILNACEKDGIRPLEALAKYKYAKSRPKPEGTVPEAVAAVFDAGWYVATEQILYFYAPDRVASSWHESQIFVIEINGHRFFAENQTKEGATQ